MAEIWEVLTTVLVGFLILDFLKLLWSSRDYPPGPLPLPLIGGLWFIGTKLSKDSFTKLSKQYGDICTVWLWHQPVVVISGFHAIKESLNNHSQDFANWPISTFLLKIGKGKGVAFANGPAWKEQRTFTINALRQLGLGKKDMESKLQEVAHQLVETFARTKGQPMDPLPFISASVCNMICVLNFGYRFSPEDTKFQMILEYISNYTKFGGSAFLLKQSEPNSTFDSENMAHCIMELFVAGTETTGCFLKWALLLMAMYPDIQDKVYKEMETILGPSDSICYEDRWKLPYTQAVLHEIMRSKYVMLFGFPRETVKNVNVCGVSIPKGTFILANFRSVLHDPKQWENPKEFNPNHFLDKEGNFTKKVEFLPFGTGARICLGENLARHESFLLFTNLLRSFKLQLPEGVKELNQEPLIGITLHPQPFKICAIPRCRSSLNR